MNQKEFHESIKSLYFSIFVSATCFSYMNKEKQPEVRCEEYTWLLNLEYIKVTIAFDLMLHSLLFDGVFEGQEA